MENKKWTWKILLILGTAPFLFALGFCFISSLLDRGGPLFGKMTFWDYLVFYSFLYWQTYAIGIILIALAFVFRRRSS